VVLANSKDVEMGRASGSTAQMEEKPMAMPLQTKKKGSWRTTCWLISSIY